MFDEFYYAKAGCVQATDESPKTCRVESSDERFWLEHEWDMGSWVHPPLGKLTIGLGIRAFSMSSFGWRFTSALAGIGVAVFTALMAQLLFTRPMWTFAAGLLIGVAQAVVAAYWTEASTAVIFAVMALVLLVRPQGMFGIR